MNKKVNNERTFKILATILAIILALAIAVIVCALVGCTEEFVAPDMDAEEDAEPDAPLDVPVDDEDDPAEEDPPCGHPDGDCDSDDVSPAAGDCCDTEALVRPGQENYFMAPYYCPDESYDYDCSGTEELEHEGPVVYCPDHDSRTACEAAGGWYDSVPACGQSGRFVACEWRDGGPTGWICGPETVYEGTARCR